MVALPGTRGGLRSSHEPRGPGSSSLDRELTGPCPLQRRVGHRDRRAEPTPALGPARGQGLRSIFAEVAMVFGERPGSLRWIRPSAEHGVVEERVREISRPRDDLGTEAELDVFVATTRPAMTFAAAPTGTDTTIVVVNVASPTVSCVPSPPDPLRPTKAVLHVQRLAVQRQGPFVMVDGSTAGDARRPSFIS